jgi:hypothetical protein
MNAELKTKLQDLFRRAKEVMTDDEMMDISVNVDVDGHSNIKIFSLDLLADSGSGEIALEGDNLSVTDPVYGIPLSMLSDEIISEVLEQAEIEIENAESEVEKVLDRNYYATL